MSKKGDRAASAEREFAAELREFKIPAKRVVKLRFEKKPDVEIEGFEYDDDDKYKPRIVLDSKYKQAGFTTSRLNDETEAKYCQNPFDMCIMFYRTYKASINKGLKNRCGMDSRLAAMLLAYWLGRGTKDELWEIYTKGNKVNGGA